MWYNWYGLHGWRWDGKILWECGGMRSADYCACKIIIRRRYGVEKIRGEGWEGKYRRGYDFGSNRLKVNGQKMGCMALCALWVSLSSVVCGRLNRSTCIRPVLWCMTDWILHSVVHVQSKRYRPCPSSMASRSSEVRFGSNLLAVEWWTQVGHWFRTVIRQKRSSYGPLGREWSSAIRFSDTTMYRTLTSQTIASFVQRLLLSAYIDFLQSLSIRMAFVVV